MVLARVYAISDPTQVGDPEYLEGLRSAVRAAVDYGLSATVGAEKSAPPIPPELLAQARQAARSRISLDTVLRRYFAGYTLLGEFVTQEARAEGALGGEEVARFSRAQARLFDRLVEAITEAHRLESSGQRHSVEHVRAERVKRLLAGELIEDADLGYQLGARWHLGALACGPGARQALCDMAAVLDRHLLFIRPGKGAAWAWLGGKRRLSVDEHASTLTPIRPEEVTLAIGEPAYGISGWRLTHRQAAAALPIALRDDEQVVRYRDVALLASAVKDDVLSSSLKEIYLDPLVKDDDEGVTLRRTLQAYFAAGRNVSSAAARLGISRHTVSARLQVIEDRIGRSLDACAAEMETALRLQHFSEGRLS